MSEAHYGTVVDRRLSGGGLISGAGHAGSTSTYVVQDETDGHCYFFDYRQIVTEGFRTMRIGESVRFHSSATRPGQAEFVIRLNQPDPAEYYR